MIIKNIGNSLSHILPELIGQDISNVFDLTRPLVEFKFASVRNRLSEMDPICDDDNYPFLSQLDVDIEKDQQYI